MIKKIEISGIHTEVTDDLHKYITKKISRLDQYMPVHARKTAHASVKIKEYKLKNKIECYVEVIMHLPHDILTTKETTMNMFAAVDVVEEKLKNQIKKYKVKHGSGRLHQRVLARIKRTVARTEM